MANKFGFFYIYDYIKKRKWHCEVRNTIIMKTDMMIVQIPKYLLVTERVPETRVLGIPAVLWRNGLKAS